MNTALSNLHTPNRGWIIGICFSFMLIDVAGCGGGRQAIHFSLPDDFAGPFVIVVEQVSGTNVPPTGRITYQIPATGVLRVTSFAAFDQWHIESASFANRKKIPVALPGGEKVLPSTIACRDLGMYANPVK